MDGLSQGESRPNIILIVADDLGWGDLGCYGATRIPTPNLDALAANGVRVDDAHSSSSVCTPSRYSIMTGRYAWRGPLKKGVLGPHGPAIIERGRTTLASLLRDAGYATGAFGKWHLGLGWQRIEGPELDAFGADAAAAIAWDPLAGPVDDGADIDYLKPFTHGPLELGFDQFFGISGSLDMPPYCFLSQDRTVGVPSIPKELAPGQRPGLAVEDWADDQIDVEFVKHAVKWLEEERNQPFFLYLSTAAPHRPCVPPAFARGRTGAGPRGDGVFVVDWMAGQVVGALEKTGQTENTIVIFTSDNGASLRFPAEGDPAHKPNGDWRGQKADAWEGGHREPLIVRWPARLAAGGTLRGAVCLTDLMPTIAAAVGVQLPAGSSEDGTNLLPLLEATDDASTPDRVIVHHTNNGSFAVRQGRYKAIFSTGSGGFTEPVGHQAWPPAEQGQLYDLVDDPGETRNLWADEPLMASRFFELLKETAGSAL